MLNSRVSEAVLLERCALVVRGDRLAAQDEREANLLRLASMLVRPRRVEASVRLRRAADEFFAAEPAALRETGEMVRLGWVVSLPRFRELLDSRLAEP